MANRPVDFGRDEMIAARFLRGDSVYEIALDLHLSQGSIYKAMRRIGMPAERLRHFRNFASDFAGRTETSDHRANGDAQVDERRGLNHADEHGEPDGQEAGEV